MLIYSNAVIKLKCEHEEISIIIQSEKKLASFPKIAKIANHVW